MFFKRASEEEPKPDKNIADALSNWKNIEKPPISREKAIRIQTGDGRLQPDGDSPIVEIALGGGFRGNGVLLIFLGEGIVRCS